MKRIVTEKEKNGTYTIRIIRGNDQAIWHGLSFQAAWNLIAA